MGVKSELLLTTQYIIVESNTLSKLGYFDWSENIVKHFL